MDLGGGWDDHLPLVEFTYNNSYHCSIEMAPYKALYRRKYRIPLCWNEVAEREQTRPKNIKDTSEKVTWIRKRLKTTTSRQKSYADKQIRPREFEVGNKVFLKMVTFKGVVRFGK